MTRSVPSDLAAEQHVIGCCVLRPAVIPTLVDTLRAEDFYSPKHAATFSGISDLWMKGQPVDAHSLIAAAPGGMDAGDLVSAMSGVPATGHAERYAAVVVEHAARRQLIRLAGEMAEAAYAGADPGETVDQSKASLEGIDLPGTSLPSDLHTLADVMNRPEADRQPWVIPGLLRQDWRTVLVAPEGAGKSLVLQQVGICASQGIHPFGFEPIPPVRVLFVDLENPEERIVHGARLIDPHARRLSKSYDADRVWIWNRPGGINLRTRSDRATLEAVLSAVRPSLVCMGPAYKTTVKEKGEGWDDSALGTQRVLDQLRMRFQFALLMEDHAPQSNGGVRDLRPFGSSVWLRWPEMGLKLKPDDDQQPTKLTVGKWRGDRLPNEWPSELHRGTVWPWSGYWEQGRRAAA